MSKAPDYTAEQIEWLRENYLLMMVVELTTAFNQHYGQHRAVNAIKSTLTRYGFKSGRNSRYVKGGTSWNKGKKGIWLPNSGNYQKGNLPHNHTALWSERISKDGYIEMSVPEPNPYTGFPTRYKHKHVWLWEQANGKKPKGTAVIFADGNNRNFDQDNLLLVTRAELLAMNQHNYKDQPAELKPSILALAKLEAKAGFRTAPSRGRVKSLEG